MIDHVIFDMDGTILDSERFGFSCFRQAMQQRGYPFDLEQYMRLIGKNTRDAQAEMLHVYGAAFDYPAVSALFHAIQEERLAAGEVIPVKKGYHELAAWLKAHRIPSAVATSTSRMQAEKKLRDAGILNDFQFILCGDEVVNGKPDPEIYRKASARFAGSSGLVIEDSYYGVQSAASAGLPVVFIPDMLPANDLIKKLASYELPDLKSVIMLLEQGSADKN